MSIQSYKNNEIQKLIDQAFEQFGVVDSNERLDIAASIKTQLDTSTSLSQFTPSVSASSSKYRSDVRLTLIDIIAQLLHSKDIDNKVKELEGISRGIMEEALTKINSLEKTIIQGSENIRESFEEHIDSGIHDNTMIKDGYLRVSKFGNLAELSNFNMIVSPAESITDEVTIATSGSLVDLNKSGAATDSFWIRVAAPSIPEFYEINRMVKGVIVMFTFDADNKAMEPMMASIKGSGFFRIFSLEGSIDDGLTWEFLGSDPTYGEYSFVEIDSSTSYSKYRLRLHIPSGDFIENVYYYNLGIHNIKIFNKNSATQTLVGKFNSYSYKSDKSIFKASFDSNYDEYVNFKVLFDGRDEISPIPVIPRDLLNVKLFIFFEEDDENSRRIALPFNAKEDTLITLSDESGLVGSFNPQLDDGQYLDIPESVAYDQFIFLDYEVDDTDKHEAVLESPLEITDEHDYIDGYIFPLSSTPWLLSDESSTPNFILNQFPDAINISTYTGPVSWQGPDDAGVTQQQFYYHNKKLYTNFDMLENVQTLTVTYQFMCNGVKLKIELADFAKVNDYTLQLIGIKGLVNNVPNA